MLTPEVDQIEKLDLGYTPEAAISGAVLVQTECSTVLTFNANYSQLAEDGFYHSAGTALLEFHNCIVTKFGLPNDEALPGHPLYSKMGEVQAAYDFLEVHNSSWKAELEQQNQVRFPNSKFVCRHFIITFHDSTFECLAGDIRITVSKEPYETIFQRIAQRVIAE
jgi:hypothetical protein